ncbi:AAA family ATPase [Streptomyces sp. MMG1533]|uniref:AAA family ATPase n=1 Tax=Streptomyces sp. MMG1533 TaxID=1415546 RepID=UPI0006AE3D68|nr:AAA family ATPase [Streptomyces sp. MMG1533]
MSTPPTLLSRAKPRLRRAMEILVEEKDGLHFSELWQRVVAEYPLDPDETELRKATNETKGQNTWVWQTSDCVLAGMLVKRNGIWSATHLARYQLAARQDPLEFFDVPKRAFAYWQSHKVGYAYAARLCGAVRPGHWVALGALAAESGLAPSRLAPWLWGTRPKGWFRVLDEDGRVPEEIHADEQEIAEYAGHFRSTGAEADTAQGWGTEVGVAELKHVLAAEDARRGSGQNAWLISVDTLWGAGQIQRWLDEGFCSLPADLDELPGAISPEELALVVENRYARTGSKQQRARLAESFDRFLNLMHPDDHVAVATGGKLWLGTVTGDAELEKGPDRSRLRRPVQWLTVPIDETALPEELQAQLSSEHKVVDLTHLLDRIRALAEAADVGPEEEVPKPLPAPGVILPRPTDTLAEELLVTKEWLDEVRELLTDHKQLIFYGPPGTGKTHLALHIAEHLAGDRRAVKLVQFHPSYAYEDFIQGYRPVQRAVGESAPGALGFELRNGPFLNLVETARANPDTPHFLIIDEINRANLAKVFGELYFVLEYRKRPVDLQYSGEFTMPSNIFVIGTMNTADRSIALVDAAMRRRFAFLPLHPDDEPTRGLLAAWIAREHPDAEEDVTALHQALNSRIEDKDFKIGPSYLMRDSVYREGGLDRVWRTAILPLLEEHHYGDGTDVVRRYGLQAIRRTVAADRTQAAGVPE